jgi:hypothetical protein
MGRTRVYACDSFRVVPWERRVLSATLFRQNEFSKATKTDSRPSIRTRANTSVGRESDTRSLEMEQVVVEHRRCSLQPLRDFCEVFAQIQWKKGARRKTEGS